MCFKKLYFFTWLSFRSKKCPVLITSSSEAKVLCTFPTNSKMGPPVTWFWHWVPGVRRSGSGGGRSGSGGGHSGSEGRSFTPDPKDVASVILAVFGLSEASDTLIWTWMLEVIMGNLQLLWLLKWIVSCNENKNTERIIRPEVAGFWKTQMKRKRRTIETWICLKWSTWPSDLTKIHQLPIPVR